MKKFTIYQMAKKAKVSIATISRAMNSQTRHKVAPATLERVDRLIEEVGYTPNLAAKNLSLTSSRTIGVIVPHIPGLFLNDYYNEVLAGVSDALIESEYQFKLVLLKPNGNNWDLHNFKIGQGIDGLIVANWPQFFSDKSIFKRLNLASAVINDNDSNLNTHRVSCDNEAGGRLAAETFFRKGHRFCAVLTGPKWSLDSQQRLKGFKEICKQKGMSLPLELIVSANYNEQEAAEKNEGSCSIQEKIYSSFLFE